MPRNISRWIYRADVWPGSWIVLVEPIKGGNVGPCGRGLSHPQPLARRDDPPVRAVRLGDLEESRAPDVGPGEGETPRRLCRPPTGDRLPGPQGRANEDHVPPHDRPSRPERLGVPRVDGRAPKGDEANPTTRGEPLDALAAGTVT